VPRLKKALTSRRLAFEFLLWFVGSSRLDHEWSESGLLVHRPSAETVQEPSTADMAQQEAGQATEAGDTISVVMQEHERRTGIGRCQSKSHDAKNELSSPSRWPLSRWSEPESPGHAGGRP
jgi:hypothetical protein